MVANYNLSSLLFSYYQHAETNNPYKQKKHALNPSG